MAMPRDEEDRRFMAQALRLAARGLGNVWPNPAVGCVVVRDGRVLGRGWTQAGGRPHAETEALRRAGGAALGATAYITFEPCAHYGRTPPCTMALLHAGIRRVVVATADPDPRVDGQGLAQLRQAGVEVRAGVLEAEAEALNAGFIQRIRTGRPLVTLKLATSLDGRIATRAGASRWITAGRARIEAHRLRATHDAILIGSGTALADDPSLTCRLPGLEHRSPLRVVVDRRLRLPATAALVRSAGGVPVLVVAGPDADPERARALEAAGVEVVRLEGGAPAAPLEELGRRGVTRVLVEGGATLAASLLRTRLVDRLIWFTAPLLIGADGLPAVGSLGVDALAEAHRLRQAGARTLAPDRMQGYILEASRAAGPCSPES
ncbi:MAG TPA: bifunctional diaminohydroxyphosphoribosylaminopyrimidine deaminase/5-amino-6-(5-phosphoribosylamino)uracil reductase RibD [Geminicoccaceae bacterium]